MGDFVPGKVNHMGNLTQILPDELRIRLFHRLLFSFPFPVRVELDARQAGVGAALFLSKPATVSPRAAVRLPIEGVERHPGEQET